MPKSQHIRAVEANRKHWTKMVEENCGFTRPWLDLDAETLRRHVDGINREVVDPLDNLYPWSLFTNVNENDVLCLASGGGQQSAVFGLLGARVTVVDIVEGQLEADRTAAKHYGYDLNTVCCDMQDLSELDDRSFDFVYQAESMCYAPDLHQVYSEVSRILRRGGKYRANANNPAIMFVDEEWNDGGYRIRRPYSETHSTRDDGAVEFRYYLSDAFNGLIAKGFKILSVHEGPNHLKQYADAVPGSWRHVLMHLPWSFAIIAEKN